MILKFLLISIFLCAVTSDEIEVFEKLSNLNDKWLQMTSIPEVARLLLHPPYSYHARIAPISSPISHSYSYILASLNESVKSDVSKCTDDLVQILYHLKSSWALQMLDSDGKLSSGLLRGGIIWPGHFKECISVYSPEDNEGHGDYNGQYCVTSWTMNLGEKFSKLPLTVGMCVPDSCSAEQIKQDGNNIIKILERFPILNQYKSLLTLTNVLCKVKEKTLDAASIAYLVFVSFFIGLTVVGSIVSIIHKRRQRIQDESRSETSFSKLYSTFNAEQISYLSNNSEDNTRQKTSLSSDETVGSEGACNNKITLTVNDNIGTERTSLEETPEDSFAIKVFLCFSAFHNGGKIFNIEGSEGQLLSIHGIRFLSLTWVILGHTYISALSLIGNRIDVLKEMDNLPFQVLLQAPFSVDSFFLLSGFLLTYLFLKECDKRNGKVNWLYFYIHRYWRLTPVFMIVVFFYIFMFKYLGSGPFWDDDHCDSTRSYWWKYLLYINNFIPIQDMCLGWSWYLANDMQFYIISPLFLYPLWRWPKIGFTLLVSALIGTWTTTGVLSYVNDVIPMFVGVTHATDFDSYAKKMWDSFDLIYDKPYCRIAPYIIGIFLGFTIHRVNQRKNFLNWWQQMLGWIIALFCSLSVVYGLYHVQMSSITAVFYNSLCRSSFALGLAWVIFACETGHGGFITQILSWKWFIPLSRLTYCAYLVHPILIHGYYEAHQTALYFTELVMVTNFFGFLVMSFGLAFLLSVVFESPLMNLEKLLLKNKLH